MIRVNLNQDHSLGALNVFNFFDKKKPRRRRTRLRNSYHIAYYSPRNGTIIRTMKKKYEFMIRIEFCFSADRFPFEIFVSSFKLYACYILISQVKCPVLSRGELSSRFLPKIQQSPSGSYYSFSCSLRLLLRTHRLNKIHQGSCGS